MTDEKRKLINEGHAMLVESRVRAIPELERLINAIDKVRSKNLSEDDKNMIKTALSNQIILQDGGDIYSPNLVSRSTLWVHKFKDDMEEKILNDYLKIL